MRGVGGKPARCVAMACWPNSVSAMPLAEQELAVGVWIICLLGIGLKLGHNLLQK